MFVDDPLDGGEISSGRKFRIVLAYRLKILRLLHQVTEIIHCLADLISSIAVIGRNFGHGEIGLGKHHALGIDADEYFGHLRDIQLMRQFDHADAVVLNLLQPGKHVIDGTPPAVIQMISAAVVDDEVEGIESRLIERGDVGNPGPVLFDGRVGDLKALFQRMKGNPDVLLAVIAADDRRPHDSGLQGRDALLAVNEDLLSGRNAAVFQTHVGILPNNDVSHRKTGIQGIDQITHLGGIPHKGALNFRYGDLPAAYPGQKCLYGAVVYFILCHGSSPVTADRQPCSVPSG